MTAENAKKKTDSQLQKIFRFLSSERSFAIGSSFSALRFLQSWDGTLRSQGL